MKTTLNKLRLALLAVAVVASLQAQEKPAPVKNKATPEQQKVIDADAAIPADQAALRIDVSTGVDGVANPDFGKPLAKFTERHQMHLDRRKQPMDVLFIGDSITQGWTGGGNKVWESLFGGPYKAANFGISGDRTQHVLWRIQDGELDGIAPKAVVLLIGTNNSAKNTPAEIAAAVTKIVGQIRAKLPAAKIIVLNLLPRAFDSADPRRQVMVQTNEILKNLDNGKDVFYLRLWEPFLDDKNVLRKELMPDALHPNEAGYEIMGQAIKARLAEVIPG